MGRPPDIGRQVKSPYYFAYQSAIHRMALTLNFFYSRMDTDLYILKKVL